MNNKQPTYLRQRYLLAFIRQINESVSSTDLQKLVFLNTMKDGANYYDFLPYKFGAYSFQLAEDVDILRRDGYLAVEEKRVKATGTYLSKNQFNIEPKRGNNLIRKAYREYPYYATNSEMIDRLFYGEEAERFNARKQKYTQSDQILFTIGYEGRSIETFMNTLIQNGVSLLCDVRKNPLSRKFGFSKNRIEHIAETVGIKYIHIPKLGIESNKRSSLDTDEDYKMLFNEYSKKLPNLRPQLNKVYSLLHSNYRIALMCYEKEANMCHRHVVKDYIVAAHEVRSMDL